MTAQLDLFATPGQPLNPRSYPITLPSGKPLPDATIVMHEGFFDANSCTRLFSELFTSTQWRQDQIQIYGKAVNLPRQTAWYGEPGANYAYSGIKMRPEPWSPVLLEIKQRIEPMAGVAFNSVLLNHYRDGNDSVAWHTDAEPELGRNPIIASVSFGGTRRFMLRHRTNNWIKVGIDLTDGSLLLMTGETQHCWEHQIPKTKERVAPRINLTFRQIRMEGRGSGVEGG